ncbi:hypothetical protein J6G99_07870 [bacterium]|nr:hypothetical protein [bacterium]
MNINEIGHSQHINKYKLSGDYDPKSNGVPALKFPKTSSQKTFEQDIQNAKLDDRIPNKVVLNKMGYKQSYYDKNGGVTYQNNEGETIRICGFEGAFATGLEGSTSVQYSSKDGKTKQTVIYDPAGNPLKGYLSVKHDDGSIVKYQYEYDMDGNKQVKSVTTEYPNDY